MGNRAAHSFGLDANGILSKVFGIEAFQSRHAPELQAAEIAVLADRVQHLGIMNGETLLRPIQRLMDRKV